MKRRDLFAGAVLSVGGVAEFDGRDVLLVETNQELNKPCCSADATHQHPCCKRIECAGVPDPLRAGSATNTRNDVVRSETFGFVDNNSAQHEPSDLPHL